MGPLCEVCTINASKEVLIIMVKVAATLTERKLKRGDVLFGRPCRASLFFSRTTFISPSQALARSGDLAGSVPFFCGLQSLVPQLEALTRFSDMAGSVPFFGGNRTDRTDKTYNEKLLQGVQMLHGTVFSKRVPLAAGGNHE